MTSRRRVLGGAALLAAVIIVWGAGCNILGPASYFIGGLPQLDAEYLLEDRATVVYVDDRANTILLNPSLIRQGIAERVTRDLMKHEVILPENMIDPRDAFGIVRARDREGQLMSMDDIAREVGAEQLIFIEMAGFAWTPDGVTPQPTMACHVRVLDVVAQLRVYPDPEGTAPARHVVIGLEEIDPGILRSTAGQLKIAEAMAEEMGDRIAKLFYRHDPRALGERLQSR